MADKVPKSPIPKESKVTMTRHTSKMSVTTKDSKTSLAHQDSKISLARPASKGSLFSVQPSKMSVFWLGPEDAKAPQEQSPLVRAQIEQEERFNLFIPANDKIRPNSPVKPLRISQNFNLFGGLVLLQSGGKLKFTTQLSNVSKNIQALTTKKLGPRKVTKPSDQHFLVALPEKYREKIWRFLDETTKSTIRLVNRQFKREIDLLSGLEVIVNDLLAGNTDFIESVEATEACLVHLKNAYFKNHKKLFRCNWNIETIDVWMQLNPVTFRHMILDCSDNLQCLYLREMVLMKRYISESKADESKSYKFPCLNTILIYYGYFDTPFQNFRIFNGNMRYILSTFECPALINFQVLPEPSVIDELVHGKKTIVHESCRWESHHLKSFISRHRLHLRKLKLVLYRSFLTPEKEHYYPPTNLVEYLILFPMLEPVKFKNIRSYWRATLQAQLEVQVISSQAELWGDFEGMIRGLQRNVFVFSASTLTKIYLESYHRKPSKDNPETHILELKQFGNFQNLLELHLTLVELGKKGDTFQVHHLSDLPRKLEVLIIDGFQCLTTELLIITTLRNLKRVAVRHVGSDGIYGVTFEVARRLLIHKKMEVVNFGGFNERNDTQALYALIKKFNMGKYENEFQVLNPREKISFIDWFPCCCCMKPPGEENIDIK